MLRNFLTYWWLQTCLGLLLFQPISCNCRFPAENFPNGRIIYDTSKKVAENKYILRFECHEGYSLLGGRYSLCLDGEWSSEIPTCIKMQCPYPPEIKNADYVIESEIRNTPTVGSSAVYACKAGYELNNTEASALLCVVGSWSRWVGERPVCKEKVSCPDPGVSERGRRRGNCCFSGNSLSFSCLDGYELEGSEVITCLPTGTWSSRRPLCRPLGDHCELPPPIPHGIVTGREEDFFLPDQEATILCEPGYAYKGESKYLMCEEGGEWEAEFGECTEIFCGPVDPLANGIIPELLTTNLTSFPYGFEITYTCDDGYRLVGGDGWRICRERGWSGKASYCEVIECPDPGIPEYGSRRGDNFGVFSVVRFGCFPGYNLLGSVERHCMPNGQWTGELSRCDISSNYCPNPGIPIRGSINSTNYDLGSIVAFSCQPEYIHIGSEVRECLPDKSWSGTEAKCIGQYDFDSGARVRDILKARLAEKIEEYEKELQKYKRESDFSARVLDLEFEGRIVLYFAFDVSGSVGLHNFRTSIKFAKAVVSKVGNSDLRVGALTFSSKAEGMFLPLHFNTTNAVLDALDSITYTGGGTSASSALHFIRTEFMPSVEDEFGKKNVKSVIFILTDGKANMGGDPKEEAKILKENGVEIYCIGITGDVRKKSLYDIASTSKNEAGAEYPNVFILPDYSTLSWVVQEITNGTIDYSQCGLGLENVGKGHNLARMVGGEENTEPWPWMAALFMQSDIEINKHKFRCGGTIIHRHFILTAAHCMYKNFDVADRYERREERHIIIKLGLTDIRNETYLQEFDVMKIHIHPLYQHKLSFDYDIALLQVEKPITYNAHVRPVCLVPEELPENSMFYKPDALAWATGWGHDGKLDKEGVLKKVKNSEILKQLYLPLQPRERCLESLMNEENSSHFTDRMFCAGDGQGGTDTCIGDSGGPLMQPEVNSEGYTYWTQIGIISWGIGCARENLYGYYSHLQKLLPWVDGTIQQAMELMV